MNYSGSDEAAEPNRERAVVCELKGEIQHSEGEVVMERGELVRELNLYMRRG